MKTPFKTKADVNKYLGMLQGRKVVHISANELTKAMVASDIKQAKEDGYITLAYEWESLLGPYLTIDLNDFDEEGKEKEEVGAMYSEKCDRCGKTYSISFEECPDCTQDPKKEEVGK